MDIKNFINLLDEYITFNNFHFYNPAFVFETEVQYPICIIDLVFDWKFI